MVTELHLNNGVPMPALGFGVFQSPPEQTTAAVEAALQTIPKSVRPSRIAENFAVFDFELTADEVASLDALDTGVRLGPDPDVDRPERFSIEIPTA